MTKQMTALIYDQEPDSSGRFISVMDRLFTKVLVQPDPKLLEGDFTLLKPTAIFLNLNMNQRETSFALLERIQTLNENGTLVFAYLDGHEPELIAHAFENGILDVFMRPFDGDVIASKVNRVLRQDKTGVEKDLLYTKLYQPLKSEIEFDCKLVSVDENGFTLSSDHYVSKGTKFKMNTPLTNEIFGSDVMKFMVTKTWFDEQLSMHFLFAEPKDSKESHNASLRRFIMSKNEG